MEIELILKREERDRLLKSAGWNLPLRSTLRRARVADRFSPGLVAIKSKRASAHAMLELAEKHCGSAARAIDIQMRRAGLLKDR
jgi:hypothetical protein